MGSSAARRSQETANKQMELQRIANDKQLEFQNEKWNEEKKWKADQLAMQKELNAKQEARAQQALQMQQSAQAQQAAQAQAQFALQKRQIERQANMNNKDMANPLDEKYKKKKGLPSTMLTGTQGVDVGQLNLGKKTLLGA